MWGHLLSSESGVALLSSCLKKNGHPLHIRLLSTVTALSLALVALPRGNKTKPRRVPFSSAAALLQWRHGRWGCIAVVDGVL